MKIIWISLTIVLSIALQSFVAVADSDKSHQVDATHLQTEHSHDADNVNASEHSTESEHSIEDCHHCGHCQGSHTQWLTSKKTLQLTPKHLFPGEYLYLTHLEKSFIEELIRPPIA